MANATNYVPTSIIKINTKGYAAWLANAKARNQHKSVRAQRLALMVQCNGQTVSSFYAACNKQIGQGTVSKKLLAVAVNQKIATFTTTQGKPALTGNALTKYSSYAKASAAKAKAAATKTTTK